jgi:hypothetical protein
LGINIQQEKIPFDETKISKRRSNCTGNGYFGGGNCIDINKVVEPVLQRDGGSIYYIIFRKMILQTRFFIAQTLNTIGKDAPTIKDAVFSKKPSIRN